MKFRTEIETEFIGGISHDSHLLMLGSCFTDEIGSRLIADGFNAYPNPTGTLYNPLSVASTIRNLITEKRYSTIELIENQGLWRCFDFHSKLGAPTPETAIGQMNRACSIGAEALRRATHIIVTFGTAWVFERDGRIVCNCHKLPAAEFTRRRLSISEIVDTWQPIISQFPDKKFIFTISPIRHTADTLHGNQLSKATLLMAIEQLQTSLPGAADYFPAYEILIDDLRDYRFYATDMKHPSAVAVDYIYQHFANTYFTPQTIAEAHAHRRAALAAAHRPNTPITN